MSIQDKIEIVRLAELSRIEYKLEVFEQEGKILQELLDSLKNVVPMYGTEKFVGTKYMLNNSMVIKQFKTEERYFTIYESFLKTSTLGVPPNTAQLQLIISSERKVFKIDFSEPDVTYTDLTYTVYGKVKELELVEILDLVPTENIVEYVHNYFDNLLKREKNKKTSLEKRLEGIEELKGRIN